LKHPGIKSVSGKGLMLAADLVSETKNQQVISRCLEHGLITDWFLFAPHKLRIAPPLTITEQEAEEACRIIVRACEAA
jgi:4-aminobutyrate aminotransferase-like enzyme